MTTSILGIVDGRALGGLMRIAVTRPERLGAATSAVEKVVASVDEAASRFRPDSELSRLNASSDSDVVVGPLLARAIEAGLRAAELTGGAVDPTVGSAVRLAGYDADFAVIPAAGQAVRLVATRIPGWQAISFNRATRTVRIPRGVEIDLGATAKALAADLAAAAASLALDGGGVLVSLGGDIAVAGAAPPGGWSIQGQRGQRRADP
ncbi:MAG TPA: FAD:protein FMN transferase [Candidatus Dormibacteraeota bacterium]|nr:FAD:protein FMN transferase [Candidatus Dormibacteraeota bacterium]